VNIPSLECANCGSKQIRRARYANWAERLRGIMGIHPFRCRRCTHRVSVSIWLFGKLRYAKCPRCLRLELGTWSRRYYKVGFPKNVLIAFGAQKYRCPSCRCNFVSFRPRKATAKSGEQPEISPDKSLDQTDGDGHAAPSEAPHRPEAVAVQNIRQAALYHLKPAEQPDCPHPATLPRAGAPSSIQFSLTSVENGATPEFTHQVPEPVRPARARRSARGKTARKNSTTRKKLLQEPPPEEASGLSSG
jgi:hypothetical protein